MIRMPICEYTHISRSSWNRYSRVIYDQSQRTKELQSSIHDSNEEDVSFQFPYPYSTLTQQHALSIASHALDRLTAAAEAGILYSVHLDVTIAWLEDLSTLARKVRPIPY